jgi:cell division septation protein DedD
MKFLFWLLLILNLAALAYFNVDLLTSSKTTQAKDDIAPEKMQLLSENELKSMPKRSGASVRPQQSLRPSVEGNACYEWGNFTESELNGALTLVNAFFIKNSVEQQAVSESTRYWVYKPPLASLEAANAKAREIKALGINDFFIVQEPKMRYAISFGVFKQEEGANRLMAELRGKGINQLVKAVKNKGAESTTLKLEGVTSTLLEQLKKNLPDYPSTDIKAIDCH